MCALDVLIKDCPLQIESKTVLKSTVKKADEPLCVTNRFEYGPAIGAASLGLLITAMSITMPHWMAQLDSVGCDSFCQGSLTSLRSACSLTGAVLIGRWSDSKSWSRFGGARRLSLWAGVVSSAVSIRLAHSATTVPSLYISVVPAALLQHNMSNLKAIVSEYYVYAEGKRAASAGKLGMAAGLAIMIGPVLGATVFPTYDEAVSAGYLFMTAAIILIGILPIAEMKQERELHAKTSAKPGILRFLDVPSARTPSAVFLLTCRVLSTLSFHIFQTIWSVSLRNRFQFKPADYGHFMSMIGLFLAFSQGFAAQFVLDCVCTNKANAYRNRVRLLVMCFVVVGFSRFLAFQTDSLVAIYFLFAVMVTSLGVTTTVLTADATQIAAPDEVGSFFGLQAAMENGSGMAGPLIGGALGTYGHPVKAPLAAALALNAMVVGIIAASYERSVLRHIQRRAKKD